MENLSDDRPYINCFMLMTIDGKVTGNFLSSERCIFFLNLYNKMNKEFKTDGTIYGKTTMNESYTNDYFPDLTKIKERYFIVKYKNKKIMQLLLIEEELENGKIIFYLEQKINTLFK